MSRHPVVWYDDLTVSSTLRFCQTGHFESANTKVPLPGRVRAGPRVTNKKFDSGNGLPHHLKEHAFAIESAEYTQPILYVRRRLVEVA